MKILFDQQSTHGQLRHHRRPGQLVPGPGLIDAGDNKLFILNSLEYLGT